MHHWTYWQNAANLFILLLRDFFQTAYVKGVWSYYHIFSQIPLIPVCTVPFALKISILVSKLPEVPGTSPHLNAIF